MTPRGTRPSRVRLLDEQSGVSLLEVLVSIFVLTLGILGTAVSLSSSRDLSTTSQRHQLEVNTAMQQLQEFESLPYDKVALASVPAHSAETNNPNQYLTECTSGCKSYQWGSESSQTGTLVTSASDGQAPEKAIATGGMSLEAYRYVTWIADTVCNSNAKCGGVEDYKRVTIAVRNTGNGYPKAPVVLTTIVAKPIGETSVLSEAGVTCTPECVVQ